MYKGEYLRWAQISQEDKFTQSTQFYVEENDLHNF